MNKTIKIRVRYPSFFAFFEGDAFGCYGNNPDEAISNLIKDKGEQHGIKLNLDFTQEQFDNCSRK